jgi:thiol-disulfide isomerase/thioredoxin
MSPRGRLLAAAAAVAVAALVAIGVLLARGGDGARPVAAGNAGSASVAGPTTAEVESPDVVDISGTDPITGEDVSLDAFADMPVVLNFWASWCAPCRDELPALIRFAERHPEAAVVGVNLEDTPSAARELHRQIGWPWPSIADPNGDRGAELGLQGMPTTFFLDRNHRIAAMIAGGTDEAGFEEGLALAKEGIS